METRIIASALLAVVCSCSFPPMTDEVARSLGGTHRLRKIIRLQGLQSELNETFGLISSGVNGKMRVGLTLTFSWEMNDGVYAISSLPIEHVRVSLEEVETPSITFDWWPCWVSSAPSTSFRQDSDREIEVRRCSENLFAHVRSATIHVRERDWQPQIQLPLNG